ncbi:hypothetical protein Lal_00018499 [Lupinus albus]|nr:hypothetical protein Lal_00018499 [Lupinus albus]
MLDIINHMCPTSSITKATTNGNVEHAVPVRNDNFHSETRVFHSESHRTDGTNGYFTEHNAVARF